MSNIQLYKIKEKWKYVLTNPIFNSFPTQDQIKLLWIIIPTSNVNEKLKQTQANLQSSLLNGSLFFKLYKFKTIRLYV